MKGSPYLPWNLFHAQWRNHIKHDMNMSCKTGDGNHELTSFANSHWLGTWKSPNAWPCHGACHSWWQQAWHEHATWTCNMNMTMKPMHSMLSLCGLIHGNPHFTVSMQNSLSAEFLFTPMLTSVKIQPLVGYMVDGAAISIQMSSCKSPWPSDMPALQMLCSHLHCNLPCVPWTLLHGNACYSMTHTYLPTWPQVYQHGIWSVPRNWWKLQASSRQP